MFCRQNLALRNEVVTNKPTTRARCGLTTASIAPSSVEPTLPIIPPVIHLLLLLLLAILLVSCFPLPEPLHLHEPKHRNRAQRRQKRQRPPRQNDIPPLNTPTERGAADGRPSRSPDGAHARRYAVECAQDAQAYRAVGEQDGGAWEGKDAAPALAEHDDEDAELLGQGRGEQGREGENEVDEREGEGAVFEAAEDAVAAGQRGEGEELDEHAGDAVEGEEEADARGLRGD